ncbi:four helix bundle protein [Terricaulis silvestris]|uniref:Four helix bundle protein n=1 Tax=Terricaulis silvestris TaxID=2686094 RepID=A0A6I6MIY3_9CAUL|nr:four helix bundle protein [Terricaulis silvestris]QGZ95135.1 four helix bundle protein [Terricaulis silvestris]
MTITSYRDLKIWQLAIDLAEAAYSITRDFPNSELYGLTSQMRRAAVSIAANIAEGHGRETTGAFIQFLRIAQGPLKELETHLIIARRLDLTSSDDSGKLLGQCDELGRMVRGLIRSLQEKEAAA